MKVDKSLVASVVLHVAVLGWGLFSFTSRAFESTEIESVPVEFVTDAQLTKITAGSKSGTKENLKPQVDKVAEAKPVDDAVGKISEKSPVVTDAAPDPAPPIEKPVEKKPEPPKPVADNNPKDEQKPAENKPDPTKVDPIAEAPKKQETKKQKPIDLPQTQAKSLDQDKTPLTLLVKADGKVFINNAETPINDLIAKLKSITDGRGSGLDERIFMRADKSVDYGTVAKVMGLLSGAGFKRLALVTEVEQGN